MSEIANNISSILEKINDYAATLIAVSKTKPNDHILEAYNGGQVDFGENKVQELVSKSESLPSDIRWHMIGHLQRNKVKQIAPFVHLIHSVDSERLLMTVENEGKKINRKINCLLQVHIASESTKFGFDEPELLNLMEDQKILSLQNVSIVGLMGMATFTDNKEIIKNEFTGLKALFDQIASRNTPPHIEMKELSMGMSGDYIDALNCGSTMIRVGSSIFGSRNYA